MKIIYVKDLNTDDKSNSSNLETDCNSPKHEIDIIPSKKTFCDTIKKKKLSLILIAIIFVFFLYILNL